MVLVAETNLNTLIDFRFQQHFKAETGHAGTGKKKSGKSGNDLVLKVPIGTQIFEEDNNTLKRKEVKMEWEIKNLENLERT